MSCLSLPPMSLVVVMALSGACGRSDVPNPDETGSHVTDSARLASAPPAERRVSNVMIGRRVGDGNQITEPTFQFSPQDTVYLSVGTFGADGATTLSAAWRAQTGEVIQQSTVPAPPPGENVAFRLSQPKGLKPGNYKVVVFLGSDSIDAKVFVVQK
jgi:hypothetical protein